MHRHAAYPRRSPHATHPSLPLSPIPTSLPAAGDPGSDAVVREFHEALSRAPDMAVAVAAIKAG